MLTGMLAIPGMAISGNIHPIQVTAHDADVAAWQGNPDKPALVEALSRTPGHQLSRTPAKSTIQSVPMKGQVLADPAGREQAASILKMPRRVIPGGTNVNGFLCSNTLGKELGFYTIPLTNSANFIAQCIPSDLDITGFQGGASSPEYAVVSYYGSTTSNGEYSGYTAIVDRRTWKVLGNQGDYGEYYRWASDMTYDPTTNRFYGCFMSDDSKSWELGYMQVDNNMPASTVNKIIKIATLETSLNGLACDENGVLWGIRNDNGALVTINRKTGKMTQVTSTGITPKYNGSMTWDNSLGILYWSICYDEEDQVRSALCTVNPETGEVLYVNNFDGNTAQIGALGADFAAKSGAPSKPENLVANFAGYDYAGTVTFDVPTTLENGTAVSGNVQARLSVCHASTFAEIYSTTLDVQYGSSGVTIPLELEKAGNYTFSVKLVNDNGASYPTSVTRYVGIDHPAALTNVDITYANDMLTVSWPEVTGPMNGGYFNPDELVYNVKLTQADAQGHSEGLYEGNVTENKIEIPVPYSTDLRAFKASVTPICSEVAGETFDTPWRWFGYLSTPISDPMTSAGAWTTETITGGTWKSTSNGWAIPYNWGDYNNSWLFSPGIMMEAGEVYKISVDAYSEIVNHTGKISLGHEASSDAMNIDLAKYFIATKKTNKIEMIFACEETGVYHLGILNDTRSDTWTNVPNVTFSNLVAEAVSADAPGAPVLEVTRDVAGGYDVPVKITAPSQTHGGATLAGPLTLTVKRGSTVVLNQSDVNPGEAVEFTDQVESDGTYTYMAFASDATLDGVPVSVSQFIGIGQPVDPEWVTNSAGEEVGTVDVQWSPVNQNVQGYDIASDAVKYNLINVLGGVYIAKGLTGSEYSYKACETNEQEGVLVSVNAETPAGTSSLYGTYSKTGISFVGTPATLPMRETFGQGRKLSVPWLTVNQSSGYDGFTVVNMVNEEGIMDANGDGQALMGFCPYHDGSVSIYSGCIDVPADVTAPAFSFAVLNKQYGETNDNANIVSVYVLGDKTSGLIDQFEIKSMPFGWNYRYIDLGLLKGEKVNLMITVNTQSYTTYYFDDISLFDRALNDVKMNGISVAPTVTPNTSFNVNVQVLNSGLSAIKAKDKVKVELHRGDKLVGTRNVSSLQSLAATNLSFQDRLGLAEAPGADYEARVVFDRDMVADNNVLTASTKLNLPNLPAPTDIMTDGDEDGFPKISWTAPDLTPVYKTTTAYFESFTGYSLVHLENFSTFELTGNEKEYSEFEGAHGWELFYHPELSHSGNCFLMSSACKDGGAKEDWLVSPQLSGHAQQVTFYIRTAWNEHENYSVYASATSDQKEDFGETPIYKGRTLSNNWEQITIDLPEGTKYFAIVAKADDTSNLTMLMVDDVVYEGVPENGNLILDGYRLYRDRESVMETAIPEESYADRTASLGGHYYRVSALYEGVESSPTDEIYFFSRGGAPESGMDELKIGGAKVTMESGMLQVEVDGKAAVSLYDYAGRFIFDAVVDNHTVSIPVVNGVYILSIDGKATRLMIP